MSTPHRMSTTGRGPSGTNTSISQHRTSTSVRGPSGNNAFIAPHRASTIGRRPSGTNTSISLSRTSTTVRDHSGSFISTSSSQETVKSSLLKWYTVIVLFFAHLINYMDRFTLAGVLADVQEEFALGDDKAGLLQTVFIVCLMAFAPLFGYLGDRYSRRLIMVVSVGFWSGSTLFGSYTINFNIFLMYRGLVGIGETAFITVAPTTISDLFVLKMRSKILALFYFAIPVGSGLGYIIGAKAALLANDWRWAMRVTPVMGYTVLILMMLTIDPKRGESEGTQNLKATSYGTDLKNLAKNRSFILTTAAYVCVAFVTGTISWWAPTYIYLGFQLQSEKLTLDDVSLAFGILTILAGIIGVPLGSFVSQVSIRRFPRIDPIVCAVGLFLAAPLLVGVLIIVEEDKVSTFILIFFAQLSVSLNWAIIADITLYIVIPTRRATASAIQLFFLHTFGDAFSPYLVGFISEYLKVHLSQLPDFEFSEDESLIKLKAMQYSLFSTIIVMIIGGVFFLMAALYIVKDRQAAITSARAANFAALQAAVMKEIND